MAKRKSARARNARTGAAIAAAAGGLLVAMTAAFGQDPRSVTVDVGKCVDLKSPEERLACYESQVEATRRNAEPAPAAAEPAAAEPPAPPRGAQPPREGIKAARVEEIAPPPGTQRAEAQSSRPAKSADDATRHERTSEGQGFVATVTALHDVPPNGWVITLDNDQVWHQMRPQPYLLQPGQRVRLYPTRWGSAYRLSADGLNGFIQVERVR